MAFPVPAATTGICDVLSWAGWALLTLTLEHKQVRRPAAVAVEEIPAPLWRENTNFAMISEMSKATPDASAWK